MANNGGGDGGSGGSVGACACGRDFATHNYSKTVKLYHHLPSLLSKIYTESATKERKCGGFC